MSKEAMKRFLIETSVENAEGSQTWYVDATSEAEALEQYEQGGCDLYASNVDVTSLGEPEISGETTLDDFGDFAAEQPAQQQEPVEYLYRVDVSRRKNNECTTYDHPIYFYKKSDAHDYCWTINQTDWPRNIIVIAESAAIKIAQQPAQRKPLTDEQIADIATSHPLTWVNLNTVEHRRCFARAIEAAHGIKENT